MNETAPVATPRCYRFFIDDIPPTLNARIHWKERARLNATFRDMIAYQVLAVRPDTPLQRAKITCTLIRVKGPPKDRDNAYTACKPAMDGLVVGRLIPGDSEKYIDLHVQQERGSKRGVRIYVEEILA